MNKPKNVLINCGAFYFRDLNKKWHWLSRVSDGEAVMLKAYLALMDTKVDPMFSEIVDEWTKNHLGSYGRETQTEYQRSGEIFKEAFAKFRVKDVKLLDINKFIYTNWKDHPNLAKKMVHRLSMVFRIGIAMGVTADDPTSAFDNRPYKTYIDRNVLTRAEFDLIRNCAFNFPLVRGKGDNGKVVAAMLDLTALVWNRSQDARSITEFQIDEKRGYLRLTPSKTEKTSGVKTDIKLTPEIREIIQRARALKKERGIVCSWIFPTTTGTAYTRSGLLQAFAKYRDAAGVRPDVTFRHTRPFGATEAWEQGVSIEEISIRLGHTDIATTKKYLRSIVPRKSDLDFRLRELGPIVVPIRKAAGSSNE